MFNCTICGFIGSSKNGLYRHIQLEHIEGGIMMFNLPKYIPPPRPQVWKYPDSRECQMGCECMCECHCQDSCESTTQNVEAFPTHTIVGQKVFCKFCDLYWSIDTDITEIGHHMVRYHPQSQASPPSESKSSL